LRDILLESRLLPSTEDRKKHTERNTQCHEKDITDERQHRREEGRQGEDMLGRLKKVMK
jgi:hypothetical protein